MSIQNLNLYIECNIDKSIDDSTRILINNKGAWYLLMRIFL